MRLKDTALFGAALTGYALAFATPALAAQPIRGDWLTEQGRALVQIGPCGKQYCGRILKLLNPIPGRPTTDISNPDAALRNRPIAGITILTAFVDAGAVWKGSIYDPESGKTYASKLTRNADGTLKVQGCIMFICKTQTWKPAK